MRYARWVESGTRIGLLALVLLFFAYALGFTEPLVPHHRLAELWRLPVAEFRAATGLPTGWGWLVHARRGDVANLLGVALLAGCSVGALLALLPLYARRRERLYAALCAAEAAVILLAASGVLSAGH
ncbi:MAG: hypothetical protein ACOZJZ_19725 [Pseudomonadota bacterium]